MSVHQKVIKALEKELSKTPGWRVVLQADGGKHTKAYAPDGKSIISIPCSPSDPRWKVGLRSKLRRAGYTGKTLD